MKNVLLVIPLGVRPRAGIDDAVSRAKELGGSLIALAVLDPSETARIVARLDSAFVGERVSKNVLEAFEKEQQSGARDLLHEIAAAAQRERIDFLPLVESGDTAEILQRVIRSHDVAYAVLLVEKQSWLTRLLSRAAAVRIPELTDCDVRVIEEIPSRTAGESKTDE